MKTAKLNSRLDKINLLQRLKQGKASIDEILPYKVELWKQYADEPDIYINEKTDEEITAAQMELKEKTKGSNVIFLTVLNGSQRNNEL